jgi:uncharacterized membrane protein (UPF0127 family)
MERVDHQLSPAGLPVMHLNVGGKTIAVEVACTPSSMTQGLMHRTELPPDTGMLFIYPRDQRSRFWMKNTLIDLSAAFIDAEGVVINTVEMKALDEVTHHAPLRDARYGLEMPTGWFAAHGIAAGARVGGLPTRACLNMA